MFLLTHIYMGSVLSLYQMIRRNELWMVLTASVMVDDRSLSKRDIADFLKNLLGKYNVLA